MKKSILTLLSIIMLVSIVICATAYLSYVIQKKSESADYNQTKEEIEKMVNFINDKYNLDFQEKDCIYYREEDYSRHSDLLGNGKTYNIPYIAVFENEKEKITVVDRNGTLSDNGQLDELNYYIGRYFEKIVGSDIDFVQIRKTGNGNIEDDTINHILQSKFNEKLTEDNINDFMEEVFKEENLEFIFYVKDSADREDLINGITTKLGYLKDYHNIERVMVYIYDKEEELVVNSIEKEFNDEYEQYMASDDYYDDYKFGYYYVPNDFEYFYSDSESSVLKDEKFNTFVASAYYNLDRGYGSNQGDKQYEIVNGWYIYTYIY